MMSKVSVSQNSTGQEQVDETTQLKILATLLEKGMALRAEPQPRGRSR